MVSRTKTETGEKIVLVTHIDLDGAGCEIVTRFFSPKLSQVYHYDYDIVDKEVRRLLESTTDKILVADVSIHPETAKMIAQNYPDRVEIFDHHQTAYEYLKDYSWAVVDIKRSATKILFDIFQERKPQIKIPETLQQMVFHVNDYDMWYHTSPLSRDLNDMFYLLGMQVFVNMLQERIAQNLPLIAPSDRIYLEGLKISKKKYFQERVKQALVDGDRLVVLASRHASELAQYIRDISPVPPAWKDVSYIDMINIEEGTHSLRSYHPDCDVSEIAKQHGGGGHKKAAGYLIQWNDKTWFLRL